MAWLPPHKAELCNFEVEFPQFLYPLLIVINCFDKSPEIDYIVPQLQLRRHKAAIFQNPVGKSQIFGYPALIFKRKRLAGSAEVVKLTVVDSILDPLFCNPGKCIHK